MSRLSASQRRSSATIAPSRGYPSGRFPMPDREHARLALELLPQAKRLTAAQKAQIRARARAILAGARMR